MTILFWCLVAVLAVGLLIAGWGLRAFLNAYVSVHQEP
jgi:hypothetical protein